MMNLRKLLLTLTVVAAALGTASANAQLFRAYLALEGLDTNPCTLQAPCRLLPAALVAVANGGEIWMLNSANYNNATVNVTKSVTILAVPGAVGSVVATGGTSAMNIATPGVSVALRNLMVAPLATSPGPNGVVLTAGSKLTLENCVLARFSNRALHVNSTAAVRVADSTFRDNSFGMYFEGGATVEVARATLVGGSNGIALYGDVAATTTTAAVSESVISGAGTAVVAFSRNSTSQVHVSVSRSTLTGNNLAALSQSSAGGAASVTVSRNFVGGNGEVFQQVGAGSQLRSLGDNHVDDINSTGTYTPVAPR